MTCIQMLEKDWNFIKDYLQAKGQIIQIFMNLIFNKLSEKIKNCEEIKTLDKQYKFEKIIEFLLKESFDEYENYSKEYKKYNKS